MPSKCVPDVAAARAQAAELLDRAERAVRQTPKRSPQLRGPDFAPAVVAKAPKSAEACVPRLVLARQMFEAAGEGEGPLKQRDGFIRATFFAGQALACASTAMIGKKLGHMPKPTKAKPKKAKPT